MYMYYVYMCTVVIEYSLKWQRKSDLLFKFSKMYKLKLKSANSVKNCSHKGICI